MSGRFTKAELLGLSDLREAEVELPGLGGSVLVRGLPAAYSNQAQSDALELTQGPRGQQTATVNTVTLEALQVLHGLIDPKFDTLEEVNAFSLRVGPAWRAIVNKIDELSGIDKEAIEKANATFRPGAAGEAGQPIGNGAAPAGNGQPDVPVRAGVAPAHDDRGAGEPDERA